MPDQPLVKLSKARGLVSAVRCAPKHAVKASNPQAADGIAYERKVVAALATAFSPWGFDLSHNPWFEFSGDFGQGVCCPDILLAPQTGTFAGQIFCIEVKLTYVPSAIEKLLDLYCPVISKALSEPVQPIVICKRLNSEAPPAVDTFSGAALVSYGVPLFHWLGTRPIII